MIKDKTVEKDAIKTLKTLGKGLLKIIILFMLMEGPKHGYEIIQEVTRRSMGLWKPSPGSLYPVLKSLEAYGYVMAEEVRHGAKVKKNYMITDKGKEFITALIRRFIEHVMGKVDLNLMGIPFIARLDTLSKFDVKTLELIKAFLKYRIERLQDMLKAIDKELASKKN
ncbi:MAG: hypothetical protein DRJ60_04560 [Thermoprotei archaeon]|nr:MAG: hypothetical protein DRJ60_04560 [Thermoprotei archaeon]